MRQVRASQIERTGGPEVMKVAEIAVGEPGPGEVRIHHHACGLNYIDTYHRSGLYPLLLGYSIHPPFMGHVGGVHPARLLERES